VANSNSGSAIGSASFAGEPDVLDALRCLERLGVRDGDDQLRYVLDDARTSIRYMAASVRSWNA